MSFREKQRRRRGGHYLSLPPSLAVLVPLLYLVEGEKLLLYLLPLRVGALPAKPKLHHPAAGQRVQRRRVRGGGRRDQPGVLGGGRGRC